MCPDTMDIVVILTAAISCMKFTVCGRRAVTDGTGSLPEHGIYAILMNRVSIF